MPLDVLDFVFEINTVGILISVSNTKLVASKSRGQNQSINETIPKCSGRHRLTNGSIMEKGKRASLWMMRKDFSRRPCTLLSPAVTLSFPPPSNMQMIRALLVVIVVVAVYSIQSAQQLAATSSNFTERPMAIAQPDKRHKQKRVERKARDKREKEEEEGEGEKRES